MNENRFFIVIAQDHEYLAKVGKKYFNKRQYTWHERESNATRFGSRSAASRVVNRLSRSGIDARSEMRVEKLGAVA